MEKFAENAEETSSNHAIDILLKGNIMQLQNITKIRKWSCNWPLHE